MRRRPPHRRGGVGVGSLCRRCQRWLVRSLARHAAAASFVQRVWSQGICPIARKARSARKMAGGLARGNSGQIFASTNSFSNRGPHPRNPQAGKIVAAMTVATRPRIVTRAAVMWITRVMAAGEAAIQRCNADRGVGGRPRCRGFLRYQITRNNRNRYGGFDIFRGRFTPACGQGAGSGGCAVGGERGHAGGVGLLVAFTARQCCRRDRGAAEAAMLARIHVYVMYRGRFHVELSRMKTELPGYTQSLQHKRSLAECADYMILRAVSAGTGRVGAVSRESGHGQRDQRIVATDLQPVVSLVEARRCSAGWICRLRRLARNSRCWRTNRRHFGLVKMCRCRW